MYEVDDTMGAVINPRIVSRSDETETDYEGCLSLPGLQYPVERSYSVVLEGIDENGDDVRIEANDLLAVVFQHEADHLDGVLFIDHLEDDVRKEALRVLRDQALGLVAPPVAAPAEERL